ncbi:MAG: Ppx/GppA phosphatase family protein, partial [Miltoncostaeaceae bacterium]
LQVSRVRARRLVAHASRPLGAVRMTERFLGADQTSQSDVDALRAHVRAEFDAIDFFTRRGGRIVGLGGTIRTLAAMSQREEGYPLRSVHGYVLTLSSIRELIEQMAALPVGQRSRIRGLKRDRADVTLGGALVVEAALERVGADRLEICGQGLREGAFYEHFLAPADPPLIPDVRRQAVLNLATNLGYDRPHADHVARLSIAMHGALARADVHRPTPEEHEFLWAAAMLHDVGVLVDYHDHQRHSHYLVLNAGLPGFRHRELALIALLVRGHRKALPDPGDLKPLLWPGDAGLLDRLTACLRVAEQLERGRARGVTGLRVEDDGEQTRMIVDAVDDPALAVWSASLEAPAFERAFGRRLVVEAAGE